MKTSPVLRNAAASWLIVASLAGCATIAPALSSVVSMFAQGLITSASTNYSPRYAAQVEALLVALLREGTGIRVEPPPISTWSISSHSSSVERSV